MIDDYKVYIYKLIDGKTIVGFVEDINKLDEVSHPYFIEQQPFESTNDINLIPVISLIGDIQKEVFNIKSDMLIMSPFEASKEFSEYFLTTIAYDLKISRTIMNKQIKKQVSSLQSAMWNFEIAKEIEEEQRKNPEEFKKMNNYLKLINYESKTLH